MVPGLFERDNNSTKRRRRTRRRRRTLIIIGLVVALLSLLGTTSLKTWFMFQNEQQLQQQLQKQQQQQQQPSDNDNNQQLLDHIYHPPPPSPSYSSTKKKNPNDLFQKYSKNAPKCTKLSNKDEIQFTLVLQTSMDRLWLMNYQCMLWKGPISVAVWTTPTTATTTTRNKNQQQTSKTFKPPVSLSAYEIQQLLHSNNKEYHHCTTNTNITVQTLSMETTTTTTTSSPNDQRGGGGEGIYPVNTLRNLALSGVTTSHVVLLDIDFWPSENLYTTLVESSSTHTTTHTTDIHQLFLNNDDDLTAFVIPAFQLELGIYNECPTSRTISSNNQQEQQQPQKCNTIDQLVKLMPRTQIELLEGMKHTIVIKNSTKKNAQNQKISTGGRGRGKQQQQQRDIVYDSMITPFRQRVHFAGHNSTNYTKWYEESSSSSSSSSSSIVTSTIPCVVTDAYEPYVIVRYCSTNFPPYQEVFGGYGQNKVSWMLQARAMGYQFQQLNNGIFVIHFPHNDSNSKEIWKLHPSTMKAYWSPPTINIMEQKEDFQKYHRGQMDMYLIQFKQWLQDIYPTNKIRTGRCNNWVDLSNRLWAPTTTTTTN